MTTPVTGKATMGGTFMTKEEMFEKFPRKWLLINEPVNRKIDGEIIAGELLGAYIHRDTAEDTLMDYRASAPPPPPGGVRSWAVINSIQEEDDEDDGIYGVLNVQEVTHD